jgi:hypothetical protein
LSCASEVSLSSTFGASVPASRAAAGLIGRDLDLPGEIEHVVRELAAQDCRRIGFLRRDEGLGLVEHASQRIQRDFEGGERGLRH